MSIARSIADPSECDNISPTSRGVFLPPTPNILLPSWVSSAFPRRSIPAFDPLVQGAAGSTSSPFDSQ